MIVTCPSCSASYEVPSEAIGIEGRHVKCKKCHHVWFHDGERKILDDLINRIQTADIEVDNITFDDGKKTRKNADNKVSLFVKLRNFLVEFTNIRLFSMGRKALLRHFVSSLVALAAFLVVCLLLVSQRVPMVRSFPSLAGIYEAAGFPLFEYADVNPEDVLIIEKPVIGMFNNKKVVQANLINLSSNSVRVPNIKMAYIDVGNTVIFEHKQSLPLAVVKKEFSYNFSLPLNEKILDKAKKVHLSFID